MHSLLGGKCFEWAFRIQRFSSNVEEVNRLTRSDFRGASIDLVLVLSTDSDGWLSGYEI